MLQIVDQKWREHLAEMDYLREGINLRAMGQQDPLVAWQREGYDMFGQMIAGIDDDYVKYVMHVQVVVEAEEPDLTQSQFSAAEDPVQSPSSAPAPSAEDGAGPQSTAPTSTAPTRTEPTSTAPVVKAEHEKLGRNEPCWCGSAKKFKHCHGA